MVAITFSLPDESRDFLRAVRVTRRTGRGVGSAVRGEINGTPILVWHIGVGAVRAAHEAARLLAERPALVLCAGYGGALEEGMKLGEIVVDPRGARQAWPSGTREGKILTVGQVAETVEEKRLLGRQSGALAVDMETAVVAGLLEPAGLRVVGVRAISDRLEDAVPVPLAQWFDLERQQPKVLSLLGFLAGNPSCIAPFFRFVRGLAPARAALAQVLVELISLPALARRD